MRPGNLDEGLFRTEERSVRLGAELGGGFTYGSEADLRLTLGWRPVRRRCGGLKRAREQAEVPPSPIGGRRRCWGRRWWTSS